MGTLANISSGSALFLLRFYVWENPSEYNVKKVGEYDQEILQS